MQCRGFNPPGEIFFFSDKGDFSLGVTWVLTPFLQDSFRWENKTRSSLCTHAFPCTDSKDPEVPCPRQVNAGNKNTPSMHHPQRWNVTSSMIGLKKHSHIGQNLTQDGEPQRYSWGLQKKKENGEHQRYCWGTQKKKTGEPQRYSWGTQKKKNSEPQRYSWVTQKKKNGEPQRYRWVTQKKKNGELQRYSRGTQKKKNGEPQRYSWEGRRRRRNGVLFLGMQECLEIAHVVRYMLYFAWILPYLWPLRNLPNRFLYHCLYIMWTCLYTMFWLWAYTAIAVKLWRASKDVYRQ